MVMDKGLIIREYEQSRDKNSQIAILADLNGVSVDEIMNVLIEAGKISGIPFAKQKKKRAESVNWTPELDAEVSRLAKEGLSLIEIAERLGMNKQCIYDRRSHLKKQAEKLSGAVSEKKRVIPQSAKPTAPSRKEPMKVTPPTKEVCGVLRDIIEMLREVGLEVTECNINVLERSFYIAGAEKE